MESDVKWFDNNLLRREVGSNDILKASTSSQFGYVPNAGIGVGLQNLFNISSILIIASF